MEEDERDDHQRHRRLARHRPRSRLCHRLRRSRGGRPPSVAEGDVEGELARFEAAVARAEQELAALKDAVTAKIGADEAGIFVAQAMVLTSPPLREQVPASSAASASTPRPRCRRSSRSTPAPSTRSPTPYLRERAADIRDVGRRVLAALVKDHCSDGLDVPEGAIVVSEELLPSATVSLEFNRVRGFVPSGAAASRTPPSWRARWARPRWPASPRRRPRSRPATTSSSTESRAPCS
jgi:phosphoenolpyruvate-protein kinase (PTS system EI component)